MASYFKNITLLLLALSISTLIHAQDTYNSKDWSTYVMDLSGKKSAPKNLNNDKRNGFYYIYTLDQLHGKWLRVSASTDINTDDFMISLQPYDANSEKANNDYFPSTCTPVDGVKICSNLLWLTPQTSKIAVTFSWPKKSLATPENIKYQIAEAGEVTVDNENKYKTWVNLLKQKYYRTKDVDWEKVYAAGLSNLASPSGIDPLLRAIWAAINQLPEHTKTHLLLMDSRKISKELEARIYPTCIQIDDSTWRLDLPSTHTAIGNKWYTSNSQEYISRAHECLSQPGAGKWIVNLTELTAGYTLVPIAALAPLLGNIPVAHTKNAAGEITATTLTNFGISTNDKPHFEWKTAFPPYKGKIDFIVDKHCGENICDAVVLAIRGNGRILGQASNALSISNELFDINDEVKLQLTTHWLTDKDGKIYTQIQPDVVLDEQDIEKALLGELR